MKNDIGLNIINSTGRLSGEEFLSIFQQKNIPFSTYYTNYFQCIDCELKAGASIYYEEFGYGLWKTSFTAIYLEKDSVSNFYDDCSFTITKLQVLDDNHVVIEGSFDVKIFNWYSGEFKRFSEGYFKGYTQIY